MTGLLRDHFQGDIKTILFENARFIGQGQRRKAGPAGNPNRHRRIRRQCCISRTA
jgi:hypothetical protein